MKDTDIKKHLLVPEHSKLNKTEIKELLDKYDITVNELPKIPASDAAIQGLNASPGDVIKIIRNSPTAGKSIYYRVVING